jgi:hypothetical protein
MTKKKQGMSLSMRQHLKLLASLEGASTEGKKLLTNHFVLKALEDRKLARKLGSGYRITLRGLVEQRELDKGNNK